MVPWKAFKASACLTVLFVSQTVKERARVCSSSRAKFILPSECWISRASVMSGRVDAHPWPLCLFFKLVCLVLRSLCGVGRISAESPLQAQTSDMSLWRTCEQQKSGKFFFESSVLGCDTFDKSGGEDPTRLSPNCHHRAFVAVLCRRRRRPSVSAGRFHMKPTSTWETTRICAFVGSFPLKQIQLVDVA